MANRALFDVDLDGVDQGFSGTNSQALSLTLRDPAGARRWSLQVFSASLFDPTQTIAANPPRHSPGATELVLDNGTVTGQAVDAATVGSAITTTLPVGPEVSSWIVRSIVDGGIGANGRPNPDLIHERIVSIVSSGLRKPVPTETRQWSDDGWAELVDAIVDSILTGTSLTPPTDPGEDNYVPYGSSGDLAYAEQLQTDGSSFVGIGTGTQTSTGGLRLAAGETVFMRGTALDLQALSTTGNSILVGTTSSSNLSSLLLQCPNSASIDLQAGVSSGTITLRSGATARIQTTGTGIGFFNVTPVARPNVTGSRGGNVALASALMALDSLGLITDNSVV